MGIHIIPYKLKERTTTSYDWYNFTYIETEDVDFDSLRQSGDKDFINTEEIEWEEEFDDPDAKSFGDMGRNYIRPKDIGAAKEWVKNNVYEGNQQRLLDLLDKMEKENIWIYVAY